MRRQLNRIHRARLFAHAAEDAAQFIDIELHGILFAILPRTLCSHDVNAIRGARSGAHHARNTTHAAVLVLIQPMHAAEVVAELAAIFHRAIVALLLGILDHPDVLSNRAVASKVLKRMTHRCPETLEDVRNEQALRPGERGGRDINHFIVANSHWLRDGRVKG